MSLILDAVRALTLRRTDGTFAPQDVVEELARRGSSHRRPRAVIADMLAGYIPDPADAGTGRVTLVDGTCSAGFTGQASRLDPTAPASALTDQPGPTAHSSTVDGLSNWLSNNCRCPKPAMPARPPQPGEAAGGRHLHG
jgi:hypothetical protein